MAGYRIADVIGNGLLTFTHASSGLQSLYPESEVVYYQDERDLAERVGHYKMHADECGVMARRAWEHAHRDHNSCKVARFIVEATLRNDGYRDVPWPQHIYGD